MKVLFLVTNFARWEGDPHSPWLVDLAIRLREQGIEPAVWSPSFHGQSDHTIQQIPVYRFRYAPAPWEQLTHNEGAPNKLSNPLYLPLVPLYLAGGLLDIRRRMSAQRYDVLHVHWPLPTALFGLVARHRSEGARLVASFHGAELMLARRYPVLQPILRRMMRDFDAISANSAFTARLVREITGKDAVVIPYGSTIGDHDIPTVETVRGAKGKPATILFVGRLIERKGVPFLIEAMAHLKQHTPVKLNIVGTGSRQAALERMAAEQGVQDDIHFLGRVSSQELARLYATCDAFVLPSIVDRHGDTEGLGVVLLEAMSYGRPVVASDVGGIPDIVRHESTGLLVPEKDTPALVQALKRLLTDEGLAERLGLAGQAYVRAHFTWSSIVDRIIELYAQA